MYEQRVDYVRKRMDDPLLGKVIGKVRDRQAEKFMEEYEKPEPQSWFSKLFNKTDF